jgi:hypothetical protein
MTEAGAKALDAGQGALPRKPGWTREATAADAPEIARIFMKVFRGCPDCAPQNLIDDILAIFVDHPDARPGMGSLVHEAADGRLTGFLGLVPTPALFDEKRIFAATLSTFMVEGREPRVGVSLARRHFARPFDCHFGDTANARSVALLASHMRLAAAHSLRWNYPLNFAGGLGLAVARKIGSSSRAPAAALAGAERALRALAGLRAAVMDEGWTVKTLEPEAFASLYLSFVTKFRVRPDWSEARVAWMVTLAARRRAPGPLRLVALHNAAGRAVGVAAYHAEAHGRAEIVALHARKEVYAACIQALAADALERGCVVLSGRTNPDIIQALIALPRAYCRAGPGAGVRAGDAGLVQALLCGDGALGGFVGDNWTPLATEAYG